MQFPLKLTSPFLKRSYARRLIPAWWKLLLLASALACVIVPEIVEGKLNCLSYFTLSALGLYVAAMSFVIAEKMTRQRPEEALFAGLIHDIGYFYLLSKSGNYPELESVPAALDDVLRDWHPPIGQAVLHAFKLSDATLMAVVEHENGHYNSPPRTISDVVTLANMVTARTNPIYLNTGAAIPDVPNVPELPEVLAGAKGEIESLVAALHP